MNLTLELSAPLEQALIRGAERGEIAPAEHAASVLSLALALLDCGPEDPIRQDVKRFLEERSVAIDLDRITVDLNEYLMIQRAGRMNRRPSAKGVAAHLGGSSEEFARQKQEEIELEERHFK